MVAVGSRLWAGAESVNSIDMNIVIRSSCCASETLDVLVY
jgi:hypothetical protein